MKTTESPTTIEGCGVFSFFFNFLSGRENLFLRHQGVEGVAAYVAIINNGYVSL